MRAKVKHIMFYISFNEIDVSVYVVTTYYLICQFLGVEFYEVQNIKRRVFL